MTRITIRKATSLTAVARESSTTVSPRTIAAVATEHAGLRTTLAFALTLTLVRTARSAPLNVLQAHVGCQINAAVFAPAALAKRASLGLAAKKLARM
jgi:hypothetical protein